MSSFCNVREHSSYETGRITAKDNSVFRPGGLGLTARAIALARLGARAAVVDLGCGAGTTTRYLRTLGIDAIGVDQGSSNDAAATHGFDSYPYVVASAEELPFPDGSVDGVMAECSLSLMQNQDRVLAECARVLKDGGRLMVSDLYARQPDAIAEVRALGRSCASGMIVRTELETSLAGHDFAVVAWEDHSLALRECAARYILEHGTFDGLWKCNGEDSAENIQNAMRAARAGYFLLVATRNRRSRQKGG